MEPSPHRPTDRLLVPFWNTVGKGLGASFVVSLLGLLGAFAALVVAGDASPLRQSAIAIGALSALVLLLTLLLALGSKLRTTRETARSQQQANRAAEKNAPRLVLSYDVGEPTADLVLTVRNDGGPATVHAYAKLISFNIDRDANGNPPSKREYPMGWLERDRTAAIALGRGQSATLCLAETARADLGESDVRRYYFNFWEVSRGNPLDEQPANAWIWASTDTTPVRVVVAVRVVSEPEARDVCAEVFTIATRPPDGTIVLEAAEAAPAPARS